MKYLKFIPLLLLGVTAFAQDKVKIVDPSYVTRILKVNPDGSINTSQGAGLATSSTTTRVITSSTSIVLTGSTVQVRIIPALTGTTYYMTGTGTAGINNSVPLTVGQITFDDTNAPGATVSLSGSGALLIQQTR